MKSLLNPYIKTIRLKSGLEKNTIRSLLNRLDSTIGRTGHLKKHHTRDYSISSGVNGAKGHILLKFEPYTPYPHVTMTLTPYDWSLSDIKRLRKQLDNYLGKSFVKRFFKGAVTKEIEIIADLPSMITASDIVISQVQKTYCNYRGVFHAIRLARYQAELHISAHTIDRHGHPSKREDTSYTRLTISLRSYQPLHTFDTKRIYQILRLLKIEYMSGLSKLIPDNYLKRGCRIGLEDATLNEGNVKALFDSLVKKRKRLAWPSAFFRSWTHALKKLARIQNL